MNEQDVNTTMCNNSKAMRVQAANLGVMVSKCSSLELILNTFSSSLITTSTVTRGEAVKVHEATSRLHVPVTESFDADPDPDLHVWSGYSEAVTDVTEMRELEQATFRVVNRGRFIFDFLSQFPCFPNKISGERQVKFLKLE